MGIKDRLEILEHALFYIIEAGIEDAGVVA